MRLLLRSFLGLYDAPQRLDNRVSYMYEYLPFLIIVSSMQYWVAWAIRSFAYFASHRSFADEACETAIVRLQVVGIRKAQKSFFALFAAISQVSTCHLCAWGALRKLKMICFTRSHATGYKGITFLPASYYFLPIAQAQIGACNRPERERESIKQQEPRYYIS